MLPFLPLSFFGLEPGLGFFFAGHFHGNFRGEFIQFILNFTDFFFITQNMGAGFFKGFLAQTAVFFQL